MQLSEHFNSLPNRKRLMKPFKKADPRQVEAITLGKDPYIDSLYGCFRVNNPKGDGFKSEREVEMVFKSGRKIRVTVPERMKVDLPGNVKLVNADGFVLEPIKDHMDSMFLLSMRAGWNQDERDMRRIIDLDPKGSFVTWFKGKGFKIPVGTGTVAPLGRNNSWIGMILVHPELRRQGIANAIMQAGVKYAIDQGKIINGLDATPMGSTVYGSVGYVESYRIWRSSYSLNQFENAAGDENHVKPMEKRDLPEVVRYDAAAFLEREEIMRVLFADGKGRCFVHRNDNGEIQGYIYTRPGRIRPFVGPFVADTDEIARHLLIAASQALRKAGFAEAFIDTPESKFADPGVYDKNVFDQVRKPSGHRLIPQITCVRDFTRMYQAVDDRKAEVLARDFIAKEGLDKGSRRVREFQETMFRSVMNCTETVAFMEYEKSVLQKKLWGISGPEKG
jgi:GNAT superfamily N-acetyltransferase